jgi:hypothetical protein
MLFAPGRGTRDGGAGEADGVFSAGVMGGTEWGPTPAAPAVLGDGGGAALGPSLAALGLSLAALGTAAGMALGTAAGMALRTAAGMALGTAAGMALARPEQRHRVREALLTELRSHEVTTLRTDVVLGTAERLE